MSLRLLVLAPFPPNVDAPHGGGRVIARLLVALAERHRIALLCLRDDHDFPLDAELRRRCEVVREIPLPPLPSRRARAAALAIGTPLWASQLGSGELRVAVSEVARTWRPDLLQLEMGVMAQYASCVPRRVPRLLVEHEPGTSRAIPHTGPEPLRHAVVTALERRAWRLHGARSLRSVDAVVVFTEADRQALAGLAEATVHVIPLGVTVPARAAHPGGLEKALLFVGNFVHPPNVEAAAFLLDDILPRVRARRPGTIAYVVGASPPQYLLERAGGGTVIPGEVPSLDPFLDRAAVVVAPIRTGGGMRVKVMEALAAGKAVVATSVAARGLELVDGRHLVVANGAAEFADAVTSLLDDEQRREQLAGAARAWAGARRDWDAVARDYERVYETLVGRSPADR